MNRQPPSAHWSNARVVADLDPRPLHTACCMQQPRHTHCTHQTMIATTHVDLVYVFHTQVCGRTFVAEFLQLPRPKRWEGISSFYKLLSSRVCFSDTCLLTGHIIMSWTWCTTYHIIITWSTTYISISSGHFFPPPGEMRMSISIFKWNDWTRLKRWFEWIMLFELFTRVFKT